MSERLKDEIIPRINDSIYMSDLHAILNNGVITKHARTNKVKHSIIGMQSEYIIKEKEDGGFIVPLISTRKINWKGATEEIFWFCNMKDIGRANVNDVSFRYWDSWADDNGDLGHTYGLAWDRSIEDVSRRIIKDPTCTRNMVSAWDEGSKRSSLPPCVFNWQIYKERHGYSMVVRQRSCDYPVGAPFNIYQYSVLLCFICKMSGVKPHRLIHQIGDAHIYEDQIDSVLKMLDQDEVFGSIPSVYFDNTSISDTDYRKVTVKDYSPSLSMKIPITV